LLAVMQSKMSPGLPASVDFRFHRLPTWDDGSLSAAHVDDLRI
jgi:hypothetical protein